MIPRSHPTETTVEVVAKYFPTGERKVNVRKHFPDGIPPDTVYSLVEEDGELVAIPRGALAG